MISERLHTARHLAAVAPVVTYPFPRGLRRHRATVVLAMTWGGHVRLTAPGFTPAGATRRLRRAVVRELLTGWWS